MRRKLKRPLTWSLNKPHQNIAMPHQWELLTYQVHPYSSTDTATDGINAIISSERSEIHMIDNLSTEIHAFPIRKLISFSIDKMLLPK